MFSEWRWHKVGVCHHIILKTASEHKSPNSFQDFPEWLRSDLLIPSILARFPLAAARADFKGGYWNVQLPPPPNPPTNIRFCCSGPVPGPAIYLLALMCIGIHHHMLTNPPKKRGTKRNAGSLSPTLPVPGLGLLQLEPFKGPLPAGRPPVIGGPSLKNSGRYSGEEWTKPQVDKRVKYKLSWGPCLSSTLLTPNPGEVKASYKKEVRIRRAI